MLSVRFPTAAIPRIHFDSKSSGQPASFAARFNCTKPARGIGCRQFDPYACEEMLAVGETVILLHTPLPLVGASIEMMKKCQQIDSLAND